MSRKESYKKEPRKKHPIEMSDEELDELSKKQRREFFGLT